MKKINGDNANSFFSKIWYFPQCLIKSFQGNKSKLVVKKIILKPNISNSISGSPGRILSNIFWNTINWKYLSIKFIIGLKFFDIGCGSGKYGKFYKKITGDNFHSYEGIDIYKDKNFPDEYRHILDKAENIQNYLNNHNCIVSQSALEHIEYDEFVLNQITKYFNSKNQAFIQIHLIPAQASLFLYLWHGWRQYSKKNLGRISDELTKNYRVNVVVVPLGGLRSFIRHFIHITLPNLISNITKQKVSNEWDKSESKTSKRIKKAVFKELKTNDLVPTFWALIISSREININDLFLTKTY